MPRAPMTVLRMLAYLSCLAMSLTSRTACRKAQDDEVPHGANELIGLREQKIRGLFGTIFLPNDEPAEDVVIEVYSLHGHEDYSATTLTKRLTACVTGADGRFSFPELKPGRYLLQAGVRKPHGINITFAIIYLKSNGSGDKGRGIRIPLTLGT